MGLLLPVRPRPRGPDWACSEPLSSVLSLTDLAVLSARPLASLQPEQILPRPGRRRGRRTTQRWVSLQPGRVWLRGRSSLCSRPGLFPGRLSSCLWGGDSGITAAVQSAAVPASSRLLILFFGTYVLLHHSSLSLYIPTSIPSSYLSCVFNLPYT